MRRNTDAENAFGDVMPEATVHICPVRKDDIALKIQAREDIAKEKTVYSKTMMLTATHESTGITAAYITVPVSSAVYVNITATWVGSAGAGTDACSGGSQHYEATIVASGARSVIGDSIRTPAGTAVAGIYVACSGMATGNYSPVVLFGVTANNLTWALLVETITVYSQHV